MSTRAVHVLNTLNNKLDDEGTFRVVKVYETEKFRDANKVRVYCNVIGDEKQNEGTETAMTMDLGAVTVGIYADWIVPKDTTKAGIGNASYGDVVEKIEDALYSLNETLIYNGVRAETAKFQTILTMVEPLRISGYVDDMSQEGRLYYEVRVHYVSRRQ